MHMEKEKTGIEGLDRVLHGGLFRKTLIMVLGPPGCGKSTFCRQFLYEGLSEGEPAILVTTNESPSRIKESMMEKHWDVSNVRGHLTFVDGYSWRLPETNGSSPDTIVMENLKSLNELNLVIKEAMAKANMDKQPGRLVIDSLSDILLFSDEDSVFKFVQLLSAHIKGSMVSALFVVEDGLHTPQQISTLEYIADGVIEMKVEKSRRYLRIKRMAM